MWAIEGAKKPETGTRRIEKALATAELGVGGACLGLRKSASFEVDVRRVLNWTIRRSAQRWWRVDGSSRRGAEATGTPSPQACVTIVEDR
jgi:hypothetical protein